MDYCLVIIGGTLIEEPDLELPETPDARAICRGVIAYRETWRTSSGEERETRNAISFVIRGARAEAFAKYHEHGSTAFLEGKLRTEESGTRLLTWLHVTDWQFAGERREADTGRRWDSAGILNQFTTHPGGLA